MEEDLMEHYCFPYDTVLMCNFWEPPHNLKSLVDGSVLAGVNQELGLG